MTTTNSILVLLELTGRIIGPDREVAAGFGAPLAGYTAQGSCGVHLYLPRAIEADRLRGGPGEVDQRARSVGVAVVDADCDALTVRQVDLAGAAVEGEGGAGRGAEETAFPSHRLVSTIRRGEPIVCTPEDAYRCFMRTEMDYLVLGPFLLDKRAQPEWREKRDWRQDYQLD